MLFWGGVEGEGNHLENLKHLALASKMIPFISTFQDTMNEIFKASFIRPTVASSVH